VVTLGLKIDGIATSEHIDSSGELLIVENHDISDLVSGKGVMNWEHSNKSDDTIGAIIYAKKILKKTDCENDRQRKYWNTVNKPFVYIIGELYDDEEHSGALAVAAMIRYYAKKSENLLTGFSIEGATLERDDYILKESVGRRVAVTLRPCNKTAIAGLLEDPKTKDIAKSIEAMMARVDGSLVEIDSVILDDMFMPKDPILDLHKAVESLAKSIEAGMYNVTPSQLIGQAALTREHISGFQRNRVKAAVRDWDRKRPLKEVLKSALPEVSDDYIGHFEKLAEELALKKNMPSTKLTRVGARHSPNQHQNEDQQKLIEGLYFDPKRKFGGKDFDPGHTGYQTAITKHKNDAGANVLVKQPTGKWAENATHYYENARDVFGMGNHVPVTNYFKPPKGSQKWDMTTDTTDRQPEGLHHQAMELVDKAKSPMTMNDKDLAKPLQRAYDNGDLNKLMMMDQILGGASDRHHGNYLIHPKGHVMNIDNDQAFSYNIPAPTPAYMYQHIDQPIHPEASKWIKGIDPKALIGKMADQGRSPEEIKSAAMILKLHQKYADKPMTGRQLWDTIGNHATAVRREEQRKKKVA
jgi:hypothetical protein